MADNTIAITPGAGASVRTITNAGVDGGAHQQVFTLADAAGNTIGTTATPLAVYTAGAGGLATTAGAITATVGNTPGTAVTTSSTAQIVANVASAGNVTFHLVATAFVGTVTFETSVDAGLNYAPIMAIREDGTGSETSTAISTAAALIRVYTAALPGMAYFRVRCSAFTSGSLAVMLAPGPTLIEPNPSLAASTAMIGVTQQQPSQAATVLGTVAGAITLTLTAPGAGLRHYITGIWFERYVSIATTAAASGFVSTAGNHGMVFQLPSDGQPIGTVNFPVALNLQSPMPTTTQNTATTFGAPAVAGTQYRISVTYYTAP